MKLNDMLYELLDLAKQENEPNRFAHSEEYNNLYNELDNKTLIVDEIEKVLGCPLEVIERLFRQDFVYFKYPANVQIMKVKVIKGLSYGSNPGWYFTGVYDNVDFIHASLRDYKKTWWLKEDRSM